MGEWQEVALSDLVEIKHGFAFKGEYFFDEPPGDILLTPGNFSIGGGFQQGKMKFYRGPKQPGYVLKPDDLLVTMTDLSKQADTLGYPAKVPDDGKVYLHNQRLGKVIPKRPDVDLAFLHWRLRTTEYRNEVLASYTGSTVKHTSPSKIGRFRFLLPPPEERDAIVDVLSALDDKIELNRRMNATLEAIAQAVFMDWFLDFGPLRRKMAGATEPFAILGGLIADPVRASEIAAHFPDRFDDNAMPEGWRAGKLDDIAETVGATVDPVKLLPETPYIGLEHMPRRSIMLDRWGAASEVSSTKASFKQGNVLFGKLRPYFHKVGVAPVDGVASTDIVVLDAKASTDHALVTVCVSSEDFVAFTNRDSDGTKMPRTSWSKMARYPLALPDAPVGARFQEIVQPMIEKVSRSVLENRTLEKTRDYLLPLLMSRKVRVADAERVIT